MVLDVIDIIGIFVSNIWLVVYSLMVILQLKLIEYIDNGLIRIVKW